MFNDDVKIYYRLWSNASSFFVLIVHGSHHVSYICAMEKTVSPSTRSRTDIWLLGQPISELNLNKLPSIGDSLRLLFYHHIVKKEALKKSIKLTTVSILNIWQRAKIPTAYDWDVCKKLEKLHSKWQNLKKSINRDSVCAQRQREEFRNILPNLFDVAHQRAMDLITIPEDKDFLLGQRKKGRQGFMTSIDMKLTKMEERREERKQKELRRIQKAQESQYIFQSKNPPNFSSDNISSEGK